MAEQQLIFSDPDSTASHYVDWGGEGPVLHIAHATGLAAGAYRGLAERLTSHAKVVGLDFHGHGGTKVPKGSATLKNWNVFYNELELFFAQFGRPVVALGHSLGGTASLVVAARRPDLVSALILIEPGIMPPSWRPWVYLAQKSGLADYVPFVTRAAKRKNGWSSKAAARAELQDRGPFRNWKPEFLEAYIDACMEETEHGSVTLSCDPAWEARCLATAPVDVWRYVPQLRAPTLLLYGALSTTFLPAVARRFQTEVPNAVIHRFEDTGHFVPMERPEESADVIFHFLKQNGIVG